MSSHRDVTVKPEKQVAVKTLSGDYPADLDAEINMFLADNWRLNGQPFVSIRAGGTIYHQQMVKYQEYSRSYAGPM